MYYIRNVLYQVSFIPCALLLPDFCFTFISAMTIKACPHYAWWRRATWRGPSGVVCLELPPVGVETLGE